MTSPILARPRPHSAELRRLWDEAIQRNPRAFTSDIAAELAVSEAELIASRTGEGVIRIAPRWHDLLNSLGTLGRVKTVTRNAHAVIEKDGVYPEFQSFQVHSMFVSDEIDLRLTLGRWASAFAYEATGRTPGSASRSIQFFAPDGSAIHKLFLKDESNAEQFYALVARFQHEDQSGLQEVTPRAVRPSPDRQIDQKAFLGEWGELKDTHHFFGLLQKYRVTRPQAMQLAEERFARRVSNASPRLLMQRVSETGTPVMVFLGNPGCIQIHKGPLKKLVVWNGWLNVMDPEVEIHLREQGVAQAWVVEKPTSDGRIYSLEFFDADGGDIGSIFGVRKEGKRQDAAWHEALADLPDAGEAA